MLNNICSDCGGGCEITVVRQSFTEIIPASENIDLSGLISPSTTQILYKNNSVPLTDSPSDFISGSIELTTPEYVNVADIDLLFIRQAAADPRFMIAYITSVDEATIKQIDFRMLMGSLGAGTTPVLIQIWNFLTLVWEPIETIMVAASGAPVIQDTTSKYEPTIDNFNSGRFFIQLSTDANSLDIDYASVRIQTSTDGYPNSFLHFSTDESVYGVLPGFLRSGSSTLGYIASPSEIRSAKITTSASNSLTYNIIVNTTTVESIIFAAETTKTVSIIPIVLAEGDIVQMSVSGSVSEVSAVLEFV